jgi:hypothetical protein
VSNFVRWSVQFWYCTSTFTFGYFVLNAVVAAATSCGQPVLASCCSQTVSVPVAAVSGPVLADVELLLAATGVLLDGDGLPVEPVFVELLLQPATATSAATTAKLRCCAFTRILLGCLSAAFPCNAQPGRMV